MNKDQIKGNWKQFVGKAKEKWASLPMTTGGSWRENVTN